MLSQEIDQGWVRASTKKPMIHGNCCHSQWTKGVSSTLLLNLFIEKIFIQNSHTFNVCSVPSVEGVNSKTEIPINFG